MRYRKIDPRVWNDEKFDQLSDDGKLGFLFLLTHPNMTALGAMRATWPGLAAERGWTVKRWTEALAPAVRLGMVEVNHAKAYVGLPHWHRYNGPENPNVVKGAWLGALDLLPECSERNALLRRCLSYLEVEASPKFREAMDDGVLAAFREALLEALPEALPQALPDTGAGAGAGAGTIPLPLSEGNGKAHTDFTPQGLAELWNQLARPPVAKCLSMAGRRLAHAAARLREHPDREFWDDLFRRFTASPYVRRGGTEGTWRPGIDFLLRSDNIAKVQEGTYDDRAAPGRRQTVDFDEHTRAVRALGRQEGQ